MSNIFGNSNPRVFSSPESIPWFAPIQIQQDTSNLPRNQNRYTKYYGIQAPYDTDHTIPTFEAPTRYGKTTYKDTSHLIVPENNNSSSSTFINRIDMNSKTISSEDKEKQLNVTKARIERRRNYMQEQQERKLIDEEKANHQEDIRRESKSVRKERYEKIFEEQNRIYKSRQYGRKAYDKNMTIEEMRSITKK